MGLQVAILAAVSVAFSGCRKIIKVKTVCLKTTITDAANQNQPVAVDILLVRDKDLIKKLAMLTAADWFDKRAQFTRDYPNPKDLVVYHREWVPGQIIPCSNIPLNDMPRADVSFCKLLQQGRSPRSARERKKPGHSTPG